MNNSSKYTLPETGETFSLISGEILSGGTVTIPQGTVVSGGTLYADYVSAPPMPPTSDNITNTRAYDPFPISQVIPSGAGSLDTVISGISYIPENGMISELWYEQVPAYQIVQSGGFASHTILGPNVSSVIQNGGTAYNVNIYGGSLPSGRSFPTDSFNSFPAEQTVEKGGTLHGAIIGSQSDTLEGPASGTLVLNGGTADHISAVSGTIVQNSGQLSDVTLESGATLSVGQGQMAQNIIVNGGTIVLNKGANLTGRFSGTDNTHISFTDLGNNPDMISARIVRSSPQTSPQHFRQLASIQNTSPHAVMNILSNGQVLHSIDVPNNFDSPYYFQAAPTGRGMDMVIGTPCFCPGTRIATPDGERPVENLNIGDRVLTFSGQTRAIHWIGRRSYDPVFALGNRDVLPIRFKAGSLGANLPNRDLTVSPLHAMFLNGYLIPALHLVNNLTITQITHPEEIRYIHLELETHDLILAEGAPTETFLDDGSRGMFHNADEYETLYPSAQTQPPKFCAPRLEDGPELAEIHSRLQHIAENQLPKNAA